MVRFNQSVTRPLTGEYAMRKWEYELYNVKAEEILSVLRRLGSEGWEVVSVNWFESKNYHRLLLKREVSESAERKLEFFDAGFGNQTEPPPESFGDEIAERLHQNKGNPQP